MNEWEKLLRSWAPRRPSAKLERRLFPHRPSPAEASPAFRLGWLAPATATLLLVGLLYNQRGATSLGSSDGPPLILLDHSVPEANYPPADAFVGRSVPAGRSVPTHFTPVSYRLLSTNPAAP
jgi:hypothetical protein